MKITIGRAKGNDYVLDHKTISSRHIEVEIISDSNYIIKDLRSQNGTFLNDFRIAKSTLKKEDKLLLGNHHVDLGKLMTFISQFYEKNKTNYSKEYSKVLKHFEDYQKQKDKIIGPSSLAFYLRLAVTLGFISILLFFPNIIPDPNYRIVGMMMIGVVFFSMNFFFNSPVKKQQKTDLLNIEFKEKLICPKCKTSIIKKSFIWAKNQKKCDRSSCNAIYTNSQ